MKNAAKYLLFILGAVGLSACESMPTRDTDSFVDGHFISSRDQALYEQYKGGKSAVGYGDAFIQKLNAIYSNN